MEDAAGQPVEGLSPQDLVPDSDLPLLPEWEAVLQQLQQTRSQAPAPAAE